MKLPKDKDSGLNLTDISYNHRLSNIRMSEDEYRDTWGDPYQCPTCKKDAYTFVEGDANSPDCDSCWTTREQHGIPHESYPKPEKPMFANKPAEFWDESNYRSKEYGLHVCDQTNDMTGDECGHVAESRWGLEEHWDHDPEHNGGKEY